MNRYLSNLLDGSVTWGFATLCFVLFWFVGYEVVREIIDGEFLSLVWDFIYVVGVAFLMVACFFLVVFLVGFLLYTITFWLVEAIKKIRERKND